ncbi:ankyrin repeat domain-containing protein [Flavobacteriaceae bacterium F89]|uniref:Ankyrin repeat domain-containing protein n=1 Tax=Cerina litoralis TaxID=2874477 RepID=A0AAE3EUC5_9FLAO|nr:ankyrin repeat domain-containing protein [Cerina litoralis]MCG2460503.1 ankyrin repeat domain-containing protein [Cerina litoralis]
MKKTVLTVAMAFALMAASANTETGVHYTNFTSTIGSEVTKPGPDSFCKAIMEGDVEMVQRMIVLGEDVNQKSLGKTPAIFAARYNKAEIMKILIANGADLSIKCDKGFTVEKYAELSHATEVLKVLAEYDQSEK